MTQALLSVLSINGQRYNWNSTFSRIDGIPQGGIQKIVIGEKLDLETVYSQTQDGKPIGSTGGQYSVENFEITMLREWADSFTSYLAAKPPFIGSIGRTEFSYQLQISEPLLLATPILLSAATCRVVSIDEDQETGSKALVTIFKLWSDGLIKNGKTLYSPALPGVPT
jgi:hypothetical protein